VCVVERRDDNNHEDRGLNPERFLDDGVEVGHVIQQFKGHGIVGISTDTVLLLANLGEDIGMISQVLEGIDQTTAHSILAGEQEGEDDHGHFTVTEFLAALPFWILNGLKPAVEHAGNFTTICHVDLALGSSFNKPLEGDFTSLDSPVDFGSGEGNREVDELEGTGDIPVLVTNLLGGGSGNMISTEDTQGGIHVKMTGDHHEGMGLSIGADPGAEMLAGDPVLDVKVKAVGDILSQSYVTGTGGRNGPKCFASEEDIERFAVRHVHLASEEHPETRVISTEGNWRENGDPYQLSGKIICLAA